MQLEPKQIAFLAAYGQTAMISRAAKAVGISRDCHYKWLAQPEYVKAFEEACMVAAGVMEEEAVRRGVEGVKRYKFDAKGNPLLNPETGEPYFEHVYSDALLIALLKATNPKKFGDKLEQTNKGEPGANLVLYLPERNTLPGESPLPVPSVN